MSKLPFETASLDMRSFVDFESWQSITERMRSKELQEVVIARWEERVVHEVYSARLQTEPALRDGLPAFFMQLIQSLHEADPSFEQRVQNSIFAKAHGAERASLKNYTLAEILLEYKILRQVIFEVLEEQKLIDRSAREHLLNLIEEAMADAAACFVREREKQVDDGKDLVDPLPRIVPLPISHHLSFWLSALAVSVIANITSALAILRIDELRLLGTSSLWILHFGFFIITFLIVALILGRARFLKKQFRTKNSDWLEQRVHLENEVYDRTSAVGFAGSVISEQYKGLALVTQEREGLQKNVLGLNEQRELREKFVALLSHDLLTPLAAIKLSAQIMVRQMSPTEDQLSAVGRIIDNANRAAKMIRGLLDANRIQAGEKLKVECVEGDLQSMITRVVGEFSTLYGNRFSLEIPAALPGLWAQDDLQRVLENLLSNALKHGSANTPISITVVDTGRRVLIKVHNAGAPIAVEKLQTIFMPYQRTEEVSKQNPLGWGIGLTLVHGIVEAHGGETRVVTSEFDGTTFIVDLPKDGGRRKLELVENT